MELLDKEMMSISESEPEILVELKRCIQIGLLCVQETPDHRPTMFGVVTMLTSTKSHIDRPRRPVLDNREVMSANFSIGLEADLLSPATID